MSVSVLVSIALTFGLFLLLRKRLALKIAPALVGAAAFILFALVLESLMHRIVLNPSPDGTIEMLKRPLIYVPYAAFAAGIFEETARFICFKILKRKYTAFSTAISYGIGHGGIEALLLLGFSMISNIVMSITINSGMAGSLGDSQQVRETIRLLTDTAPVMFLAGGLERVLAVTIQISLSVFVWHSVNTKGKLWMFPLAIVLHAAADIGAALYQSGIITSIVMAEVITALFAAALTLSTVFIHKRLRGVLN
jgi:uncharacterized membrane protein YhfC